MGHNVGDAAARSTSVPPLTIDTLLAAHAALLVYAKASDLLFLSWWASDEHYITRNNELTEAVLNLKCQYGQVVRANEGLAAALKTANAALASFQAQPVLPAETSTVVTIPADQIFTEPQPVTAPEGDLSPAQLELSWQAAEKEPA